MTSGGMSTPPTEALPDRKVPNFLSAPHAWVGGLKVAGLTLVKANHVEVGADYNSKASSGPLVTGPLGGSCSAPRAAGMGARLTKPERKSAAHELIHCIRLNDDLRVLEVGLPAAGSGRCHLSRRLCVSGLFGSPLDGEP